MMNLIIEFWIGIIKILTIRGPICWLGLIPSQHHPALVFMEPRPGSIGAIRLLWVRPKSFCYSSGIWPKTKWGCL